MDPEYTVLGRVARRIWAKTIRDKYGGNDRSQKLKYHIQTSGRSLHAQEIAFNDIRTTLQALLALQDNCNSLHTNAYDEAITTPTEESVRRALAIQLVINKEFGLSKNENPTQGSFIVEELTDLVEDAVLTEFRAISERGGVLGAMERMYQRSKIQEESLYYETMKHDGSLPIIGVNTFLDPKGSPTVQPPEVIRATKEEKDYAIAARDAFWKRNAATAPQALQAVQRAALDRRQRVRGADGGLQGLHARPALRCALQGRRPVPSQHVADPRSHHDVPPSDGRRVARPGRKRAGRRVVREDPGLQDGRGPVDCRRCTPRRRAPTSSARARPSASSCGSNRALTDDLENGAEGLWLDAASLAHVQKPGAFYVIDGALPAHASPDLHFALVGTPELAKVVSAKFPNGVSAMVSTLKDHEAGADAADELAIALSTGAAVPRDHARGGIEPGRGGEAVGRADLRRPRHLRRALQGARAARVLAEAPRGGEGEPGTDPHSRRVLFAHAHTAGSVGEHAAHQHPGVRGGPRRRRPRHPD